MCINWHFVYLSYSLLINTLVSSAGHNLWSIAAGSQVSQLMLEHYWLFLAGGVYAKQVFY